MVSLARVDLSPPDPLPQGVPIVNIDPILRCAASPRPAERRTMDVEDLLALFGPAPGSEYGALRLGHIKSDRRMHFSASLRLERLLRREDAHERVVGVMATEVRRAFNELERTHGPMPDPGPVEIRYPGDNENGMLRLTQALRAELEAAGVPTVEPVEVHRFVAGVAWQTMPPTAPAAKRVAVVDFGVVTGTTVNQLIRDAAQGGAERIAAVTLIDQLPEADSGMLGVIRAVSGPDGKADVPTAVRFVTRCSLGGFDAAHCPICATRDKYTDIGNAPNRLRQHAKRLCDVLTPRQHEEIFETVPVDLFNVPVAHEDAVDFLRWRRLLERALRDTAARKDVLDRLVRLASGGAATRLTQRGLIRLLAAEQNWLKLPPLRFTACRTQLALLCENELGKAAPEPRWLRVQALMVLAVVAPEDFVRRLPRLLASALDEQTAVDQLLLDVYRLVRRPSYDTPVGPEQLRASLIRCRDYLERSQAGPDLDVIGDFVQVVKHLILLVDQPRRPLGTSLQSAWARLSEEWCRPVERHHFEGRLLRVRNYVELLKVTDLKREFARAAEDDWEACARLVGERAVGHLRQLRPILIGDHAGEILGPLSQKRLVELSRTDSAVPVALAERLHALAAQPRRPSDDDWQAERRDVLEHINWWHQVFFAAHRFRSESPALLVELLLSAPTSLADVLSSVSATYGAGQITTCTPDPDVRVFCPRPLLYEAVEHVFENARRHRVDDRAEQRFEVSLRRPGLDLASIVVRNTGSRMRATPGKGLGELDRSLRPFGGSLIGVPLARSEWSFEAVITLQIWQEV